MPIINRKEILGDLILNLPDQNKLIESQLENILETIITRHIPEDDELYYSEALCKAMKVAGLMNNSKHSVDSASMTKQKVGGVLLEFSLENQKSVWKEFINSLPDICPYLPKGGYNLPTTFGIQVIRDADKAVTTGCSEETNLIL
jgi:hypothetical protein